MERLCVLGYHPIAPHFEYGHIWLQGKRWWLMIEMPISQTKVLYASIKYGRRYWCCRKRRPHKLIHSKHWKKNQLYYEILSLKSWYTLQEQWCLSWKFHLSIKHLNLWQQQQRIMLQRQTVNEKLELLLCYSSFPRVENQTATLSHKSWMISTSYAFASYLIPSLWLKNKSNQNDAFIEILLVFRSVLQSFKRQNSVREFFFISSCSPIWPRKRPLISISFSFICPWHGFRSCSLCAFRRLEKKGKPG